MISDGPYLVGPGRQPFNTTVRLSFLVCKRFSELGLTGKCRECLTVPGIPEVR